MGVFCRAGSLSSGAAAQPVCPPTCLPPKWGYLVKRLRPYRERVARITPFDSFLEDASAWIDSAWLVWIGLAIAIVLVVAAVTVMKVRARARARIPQYRRHET